MSATTVHRAPQFAFVVIVVSIQNPNPNPSPNPKPKPPPERVPSPLLCTPRISEAPARVISKRNATKTQNPQKHKKLKRNINNKKVKKEKNTHIKQNEKKML